MTEAYSDDASHISSVLALIPSSLENSLPMVNTSEHSNTFNPNNSSVVDLTELVCLRFIHQIKQAKTGVCTMGGGSDSSMGVAILHKFNQIIKLQEDRGVGTGKEQES